MNRKIQKKHPVFLPFSPHIHNSQYTKFLHQWLTIHISQAEAQGVFLSIYYSEEQSSFTEMESSSQFSTFSGDLQINTWTNFVIFPYIL